MTTITVLQAKPGLAMTKTFAPDGVKSYDKAKYFEPKTVEVANLAELSAILVRLQDKPRCCIIRGEFKGREHAAKIADAIDGESYLRKKVLYDDKPKHFCLIDVDGYTPSRAKTPIEDPVGAIEEYISRHLPESFQGKSYHWQLSSSAGTPGKEHLLKAHLWFWLDVPYTSAQMNAWAKSIGPAIDSAVFRTVQVHYTANPIFKDGAVDPVPVRSGLETGWDGDTVPLKIDDTLLLRATQDVEEDDQELVDPSEKSGVIGAFHRAYTVEEVIDEFLDDEFEWEDGSDRRLTWLGGGGSPGGAFVSDDRMHVGNTHNTDPLNNRLVNLFDLVRHYRFGHLDEGEDDFAIMDMQDKPSYQAMCEWASNLEPVKSDMAAVVVADRANRAFRVNAYRNTILQTADIYSLEEDVCLAIRRDLALIDSERITLEGIVQARAAELMGTKVSITLIREWLAPIKADAGFVDVTEEGRPLPTIANITDVLRRMNVTARYNVMTKEDELIIPGHTYSIDNQANSALAEIVSACAGWQMNTGTVKQLLTAICDRNQYNPVMTWVTSKAWDGVSRLEQLYATLVVDDDHKALRDMVVRKWLLTAIYAAAAPDGIAAQGMLVLVGGQYKGKSRWFKRLVKSHDMFGDGLILDPRDKDSVKQVLSTWIAELGELDATFKKADIAALKAFVTRQHDTLRKPYAMAENKFARRTVFAGNVNDETYLRDPTGNRRFWTVHVLDVKHDHDIDVQQLWAEVYETMFLVGEPHWFDQDQMAKVNSHNETFTETDVFAELLDHELDWSADKKHWKWITATVLANQLGLDATRHGVVIQLGKAAKKLGAVANKGGGGVRKMMVPPARGSAPEVDFI